MRRFYNLLVRDTMETDLDMEKIHRGNTADIKAIRNEFRNSKTFKINLALTCVTKLILSILFGIWISFLSYGTIYTHDKTQPRIKSEGEDSDNTPEFLYIDYLFCTVSGVRKLIVNYGVIS